MKLLTFPLLLLSLVTLSAAPTPETSYFPNIVVYTNATIAGVASELSSVVTNNIIFSNSLYVSTNSFLGGSNTFASFDNAYADHGTVDGGLLIQAESRGTFANPIFIQGISQNPDFDNGAFIQLSVSESYDAGIGFKNKTIFGVDEDGSYFNPGRFTFQLYESHGGYSAGWPDTVAFAGINTHVPGANLHIINPVTLNDDQPKTNIVSLFEGRADQTGDLAQWKLTGGSKLASISSQGTFTSPNVSPLASVSNAGAASEIYTYQNTNSTGVTQFIVKEGTNNTSINDYMLQVKSKTGGFDFGVSPLGTFVNGGLYFKDQYAVYPAAFILMNSANAMDLVSGQNPNDNVGHGAFNVEISNDYKITSGTGSYMWLANDTPTVGFSPTSGTGVFNGIWANWAVNQTGGANGITRGIYVNNTLTSAPNYRGIEVSDVGSTNIAVKTGTGSVQFGGQVSAPSILFGTNVLSFTSTNLTWNGTAITVP